MSLKSLFRSLGLGKLAYEIWHRRSGGGPSGEDLMREKAAELRPVTTDTWPSEWPVCRFLTGEAFWHQTVFCARSLEATVGYSGLFEFFDDGSLSERSTTLLTRLFPGSRTIPLDESMARVDQFLPRLEYPALRDEMDHVPLMKKLLLLRTGAKGRSLYLDSDMLFFKRPDEVIAWMNAPQNNFYLWDQVTSYIAECSEVDALAESSVLRHVNTGVVAMNDEDIDWNYFERFASRLPEHLRHHRLLEQTLTAIHLTTKNSKELPRDAYRVVFEKFDKAPDATLLHYCWHTKWIYTTREWARFIKTHHQPALLRLGDSQPSIPGTDRSI